MRYTNSCGREIFLHISPGISAIVVKQSSFDIHSELTRMTCCMHVYLTHVDSWEQFQCNLGSNIAVWSIAQLALWHS